MELFQKTPLALAIASLMVSPTTLANNESGSDVEAEWENEVEVEVDHESDTNSNTDLNANIDLVGLGVASGYSSATVDSKQLNGGNVGNNNVVNNNASISDNSMRDASGNIGANAAAGDNNQQANDAALAAADAATVFAKADAYSLQQSGGNATSNYGVSNNAALDGNALRGAEGNVGVNVTAGNSNLQQNSLAASVNTEGVGASATTAGMQNAGGNTTSNTRARDTITTFTRTVMTGRLAGWYSGESDQEGDVYLDTWTGRFHEGGTNTGHVDVDDSAQGATDANEDGGAFHFNEMGNQALAGTLTGYVEHQQVVYIPHRNNASMGGNSLRGASGNVGVNVSAGSNNMQRNSLSIAAGGGGNGGGTGGGGEL